MQQYYVKLEEVGKNRKLNELLDSLEFNQVSLLVILSCELTILQGRHFCQVGRSRNRIGQVAGLLQFPQHQYPFRPCTGGAVGSALDYRSADPYLK